MATIQKVLAEIEVHMLSVSYSRIFQEEYMQ